MTNYERHDAISERFYKAYPGVPFHLCVSGDKPDSWMYDNNLTWIDGPTVFAVAKLFEYYGTKFTFHRTENRNSVMKKRQKLISEGIPDDGSVFTIVPFFMSYPNVGYDLVL